MGAVFSKGGFSPTLVAGFWLASDDVSTPTPASYVDRIAGASFVPIGANGGTLEASGWGGQQKSIVCNNEGIKTTNAGVAAMFTGGVNWWVAMVGMMLPDATTHLMPNQTLFSAGLSSDAQKYMALQERQSLGSQRWIQRFGATAETQDNSPTTLQMPAPYVWILQCDGAGVRAYGLNGYSEQAFTRATGGALGVDTVLFGGLIQGATLTADGRWRWRHLMGGSGNLSGGNVTNLLTWFTGDTRGLDKYKGVVGNWTTKTNLLSSGAQQSNGQGKGTPVTTVTAANTYNMGFDSFVKPLVDPWCDATGTPFNTVFINSGTGGAMPAFVNQMASLAKYNPATEAIVCLPGGVGGSSLGSFWVTGIATSPPAWNSPVGILCLRLEHAAKNFPNPVLGIVDWYHGESESQDPTQAANWGSATRAQVIRTTINSFITARSIPVTAGFRHVINILPPTSWTAVNPADWLTVRNSQTTFAGLFGDCTTFPVQDGPWTDGTKLHGGISVQDNRGLGLAGIWG